MIKNVLVTFFILISLPARAEKSSTAGPSSTTYSGGSFNFQVGPGYEETKMLNGDNTSAKFTGRGYLANFDITLWGAGPGELRIFGSAKMTKSKDGQDSRNSLLSDSFAGGLKVFTLSWMYFGGGMGAIHQTMKTPESSVNVTNQYYFAQAGIEIPVTNAFYLGLTGIAQVNPVRKTYPMTTHSYSDGYGAFLMLIYSPPNLSVTNIISRR